MSEYIVRGTDCVLATKQEVVGELVRCLECRGRENTGWCHYFVGYVEDDFFCAWGERRK